MTDTEQPPVVDTGEITSVSGDSIPAHVITSVGSESISQSEDSGIVETVTVAEPGTSMGAEEIVIGSAESASNTAAVMQSIIDALTCAATETAGLANTSTNVEEPVEEVAEPTTPSEEDPSVIAAAAAALQVLANKAGNLSPGESISQLQQVLQSLSDLPGNVASLVNEAAQEVMVMAKAAQHATQAAESVIGNTPEKVKRTKRGKLKIHKCSECGKGFTLKVTLMRHLDLHTKQMNCEHCNKVFFSPVKLAAHVKHHHTPWCEREKNSICQFCGKGFYNNSKLKVHERIHTGERPYCCSFCEKTFQCSSHCKRHERLHTGQHPYVCDVCNKGFGSPSNLKDHAYTHTKETPYKCEKCDRGFAQWGALQRHISAIHDKKKECQCDVCGKAFARKDYLRFHVQKCHWHRCGLCKTSFELQSTFEQHVKNCNFVPDPKSTPRKRISTPHIAPTVPKRSSPRKAASEPRKRPLSTTPRSSPRKRQQLMDPSTDLLSVYDQIDDDPLADPNYEGFDDAEETEEIVEEEGIAVDSEEILEQEEISQLEDIATGEINILTRPSETEEAIITSGATEDTSDTQEAEPSGKQSAGGEATLDSLVSALMSVAELQQNTSKPSQEE